MATASTSSGASCTTSSDGRLLSCPPPPQSSTQHCYVNLSNGQGVELRIPCDQRREIRFNIIFVSGSADIRVDVNQYEKVREAGSGLHCFLSNMSRRVERMIGAEDPF